MERKRLNGAGRAPRRRPAKAPTRPLQARRGGGRYFDAPKRPKCFPSGSTLLDCVLGGGWAEGRVSNVVGDESTGKTLLAIEACANFALLHPKGRIRYFEAEAAFDDDYARSLGFPVDRVEKAGESAETVEEWYEDARAFMLSLKPGQPGFYVLDSLDALSDKSEQGEKFDKGSYGGSKPKMVGKLFRLLVRRMKKRNVTLMIISQTRDKIGVMFGEKKTWTGGKALRFYSSQTLMLAQIKKLVKTRKGFKRPYGVLIRVSCRKNKVGPPHRQCDVPILYGYGFDEASSCLDFLQEAKRLGDLGLTNKTADDFYERMMSDPDPDKLQELRQKTIEVWREVDAEFLPKRGKYGKVG